MRGTVQGVPAARLQHKKALLYPEEARQHQGYRDHQPVRCRSQPVGSDQLHQGDHPGPRSVPQGYRLPDAVDTDPQVPTRRHPRPGLPGELRGSRRHSLREAIFLVVPEHSEQRRPPDEIHDGSHVAEQKQETKVSFRPRHA